METPTCQQCSKSYEACECWGADNPVLGAARSEADSVRVQRMVGLLARWRVEIANNVRIVANVGLREDTEIYASTAKVMTSLANELESEMAGKEPNAKLCASVGAEKPSTSREARERADRFASAHG